MSQEYLASDHYVHLMTDILRKVYAFNTDQKRESVAKIYMMMMWDTSRESSAGVTLLRKEFLEYLVN